MSAWSASASPLWERCACYLEHVSLTLHQDCSGACLFLLDAHEALVRHSIYRNSLRGRPEHTSDTKGHQYWSCCSSTMASSLDAKPSLAQKLELMSVHHLCFILMLTSGRCPFLHTRVMEKLSTASTPLVGCHENVFSATPPPENCLFEMYAIPGKDLSPWIRREDNPVAGKQLLLLRAD
jgi:hypothetical protein